MTKSEIKSVRADIVLFLEGRRRLEQEQPKGWRFDRDSLWNEVQNLRYKLERAGVYPFLYPPTPDPGE